MPSTEPPQHKSRLQPLYAKLKGRSSSGSSRPSTTTTSTNPSATDSSVEGSGNNTVVNGIPLAALSANTMHFQQRTPLHPQNSFNSVIPPSVMMDPKYDSDSDFDYRPRPPPRPHKPRRLKGRRRASHSSSSSSDESDSISPLPRVRSIEALEYLTKAKQQRVAMMMAAERAERAAWPPARRCPPPPIQAARHLHVHRGHHGAVLRRQNSHEATTNFM